MLIHGKLKFAKSIHRTDRKKNIFLVFWRWWYANFWKLIMVQICIVCFRLHMSLRPWFSHLLVCRQIIEMARQKKIEANNRNWLSCLQKFSHLKNDHVSEFGRMFFIKIENSYRFWWENDNGSLIKFYRYF